jgi:F-box/WD-40 domain protein MET30
LGTSLICCLSGLKLIYRHIEGVWGVDIDALRVASASHGRCLWCPNLTEADKLDRTVKVWDRESGKCVQTLVGHRGVVTSLQLSDDMIVSGSGEYRSLRSWNNADGPDDGDVMVWNFAPPASVLANLPTSPAPLLK